MTPLVSTIISISIIFLATTLGSSLVFILKKNFSEKLSNSILGFASGIMISAGIFGLLLPAITEAETIYENYAVIPIIIGFLLGGILLFFLDKIIPHFHHRQDEEEGIKTEKISKQIKFFLAVTIHNIPEGLSIGFACGLAFSSSDPAMVYGALALAIGIAIQNFPEGAAVSVPLLEEGASKGKAFFLGTMSGAVEPVFAIVGLVLASTISAIMPWLLAFAAGAMIYVTVDELLPSARKGGHEHYGIWAFMIGFVVMMILEMTL